MKIVINTTPLLSPRTGLGYYTYHITKNLQAIDRVNEYTFFHGIYSKKLIYPSQKQKTIFIIKEFFKKVPFINELAREWNGLLAKIAKTSFDLYFEPSYIPLEIPARFFVIAILDFSIQRFPQWHPKERVTYFKRHFWNRIQKADKIICISDFVRREAIDSFGFPKDKLITIYLGIDNNLFKRYQSINLKFLNKRYNLPQKFILFVGSVEPRKNLKKLLESYRDLSESIRREFKLVLVGFRGWENKEIMETIHRMRGNIYYLGYLPEEDLAKIYNLASLFVYPSFYEGFGLPPLEAMACGCPVIVSNVASLPEVCGDAAYYVDPNDVPSIAEGITKVLSDENLRFSLIQKGLRRSAHFDWRTSAMKHLRLFEELTGRK
jgi:glycosyltransferase involved in cell wall biosynthesis